MCVWVGEFFRLFDTSARIHANYFNFVLFFSLASFDVGFFLLLLTTLTVCGSFEWKFR